GFAELAAHQRFAGVLPAALVCGRDPKTDLENRSDLFSHGGFAARSAGPSRVVRPRDGWACRGEEGSKR
ncbi:MAG: hypothetical protein ACYTG1_10150, partial [Planctomycetota bacterium]